MITLDTPILIPSTIIKRDGKTVPFDSDKIEQALGKCFRGLGITPRVSISEITHSVINIISVKFPQPTVEQVQDIVETVLQSLGEYNAAKRYILYRAEHAKIREKRPIPEEVKQAFSDSAKYFPTALQQFQFYDKYSRYNYDLGRRETWVETVDRAVSFLHELGGDAIPSETYSEIRQYILEMKALPSMRLLAMAGPATRRSNICIYNCSAIGVDSIDAFVEALIISMSGCGVGYSVEGMFVEKFPRIVRQHQSILPNTVTIEDSTEGWANALRTGLEAWFDGYDIRFDYSQIRPAGTPLKVKGGRASGPDPLRITLDFARSRILARQGSYLRPIDAHDIMCSIGNAAVSGGVRRTALLSLFDFTDKEMLYAKSGDFEVENSQRWNANNSVVWPSDLSQQDLIRQMLSMTTAGRGEPGIFNRDAMLTTRPERRKPNDFLTNPCAEINLRSSGQFCNLSIAVARPDDTPATLMKKVKIATIIGTIQSMATHFPGLRPQWQRNCEEERLLGVDITGQMDCPAVQDAQVMRMLRGVAVGTNSYYAKALGINQSAAVTCVKPSGNSSQLLNCSSGLHARWAEYYIRNVRVGSYSPIYKVMRDVGVPMSPENGQTPEVATTFVAHFPVKSPEGSVTRKDRSAIVQCEYWLMNKLNWTEHNPSVTITYKPDEVIDLIKWIWEHKDVIGGMSFLPADNAQYAQMPYVEITKEEYEKLNAEFPPIDFGKVFYYEQEDLTNAATEGACVSGLCEMDNVAT